MKDQLIFVKQKRPRSTAGDKVIKVDGAVYDQVVKVASEAGLSIQKAASTMINFAAERVSFVYEEDADLQCDE